MKRKRREQVKFGKTYDLRIWTLALCCLGTRKMRRCHRCNGTGYLMERRAAA